MFLGLRYRLAITPLLAETYYDEALTGLMALAILRGVPQVFYWGEPYGGAIGDAYPAAIGFWLFGPSTLVLRMAAAVIAVLWAWSLWFIAHRVGAGRFAILAGLLVAVPPIFLSHAQLSTHGESSAMAFATVALASAVSLIEPRSLRGRAFAWALLGVASGLSWWSSQMGAMLLVASALVLLVARPAMLRGPGPYVAAGLFFLASWPFWAWNLSHDWATFRHLATWGGQMPAWSVRPKIVVLTLVDSLRDAFWDSRAVQLPRWADILGWVVVWGVYLPAVLVAVTRVVAWAQRLRQRERPWRDPLDVVVVALWITVAAHFVTWFGTSTVLRYELTFQGTLPVLCAVALARMAAAGWTPVAGGLAAAILVFNLMTHVAFVRDGAARPGAPSTPPLPGSKPSASAIATRTTRRAGHRLRVDGARAVLRFRRIPELRAPSGGRRSGRPRRRWRSWRIAGSGALIPTSWPRCSTSPAHGTSGTTSASTRSSITSCRRAR